MRKDQIQTILFALNGMLEELTQDEINQVEDFIVNFCDDCYVDEHNNYPNFFRMTLLEKETNV